MSRRLALVLAALAATSAGASSAIAQPSIPQPAAPQPAAPGGTATPGTHARPPGPPQIAAPAAQAAPSGSAPEADEDEDDAAEPEVDSVSGIVRPATEPGDAGRAVLDALLFVPRETVRFIFIASGAAAGLVRDEQIVPRVRELLFSRDEQIGVFPTLFAENKSITSVGARMIVRTRYVGTTFRAGFGGVDEIVAESRLRFTRPGPRPVVFAVEWLLDRRTDLAYPGVGPRPETDRRNRFVAGHEGEEALYRERRARAIASFGIRPADDVEIFLSASLARRRVDDPRDAGGEAISRVFITGTVAGAGEEITTGYGELAVRVDTRELRGRPSPGLLVEGYGGLAGGLEDDEHELIRAGGRAAVFLPLLRPTNILSPKVVIDGVTSLSEDAIPFIELARQPEFRGRDVHRDNLSVVGSLDYRWAVVRSLSARLFIDAAIVGRGIDSLPLSATRFAGGFGFDLSSTSTELGSLAAAFSGDGVHVHLSIGLPSSFGDRHHRN